MIVVFGGTGFIGRYLTHELKSQGRDVLSVSGSQRAKRFCDEHDIPFMQVDVTDKKAFADLPPRGVDAVVHLAALIVELNPSTESVLTNGIFGTLNVLEYCRRQGVPKVINTSSHKVYSDLWKPECLPIKVDDAGHFSGHAAPYVIAKMAAERLVKHYWEEYGVEGITFRLTGVKGYGEILGSLSPDGDYKQSAIEMFIQHAIRGEPIEVWGKHTARRDHIYVKDVVSAIIRAIDGKGKSGIYNLASGAGVTIEDEAKAIVKTFSSAERPSQIIFRPEIADTTPSWLYDIGDTMAAFDWRPKYSYPQMIEDYKREMLSKRFAHFHYVKPEQKPLHW